MNVLAIESSNPTASGRRPASVALGRWSGNRWERLGLERLRPAARHDDALMPAIAALCKRSSIAPGEIGRIGVSVGPGGFTGVRIGVITGKLLAETTGADLVGVPTALVGALARRRLAPIAIVLAGKRETAWVARFEADDLDSSALDRADPGRLMDREDLASLHARAPFGALVCGTGVPAPFLEWARTAKVRIAPLWLSATRVLEASIGLPPVSADALAPLYPREPEAVRKWRERP